MTSSYKEIRLASRPAPGEAVSTSNFKIVNCSVDIDGEGKQEEEIIQVRPLYFSVDPYLRCQFDEQTGVDYVQPYKIDGPITSMCVGIVEKVINNKQEQQKQLSEGSLVISENPAGWPWRTLLFFSSTSSSSSSSPFLLPLKDLRSLANLPITQELASHMLGVFHVTGLTAYFGILKESGLYVSEEATKLAEVQFKSNPKKQQKVVVISSAAGGTGVIACQLVKKKCNLMTIPPLVIGVTGSDEKAQKLLALGICDKVINYKKANQQQSPVEDLKKLLLEASGGKKIDMYFDSVGGELSKAVHQEMSENGRIVLCGQIATYNDASKNPEQEYPPPLSEEEKELLFKKLNVKRERYLVLKYAKEFQEAAMNLMQWVTVEKSILPIETVFKPEGFEHLGEAFVNMMGGGNFGKMVVKC